MEVDERQYTIKRLATNLALLEEHLKEFAQGEKKLFCLDCEIKHTLLTLGFSEECIGFKCEPQDIIKEIKVWAEDLLNKIHSLERDEAFKVANQARNFRKLLSQEIIQEPIEHLKEG